MRVGGAVPDNIAGYLTVLLIIRRELLVRKGQARAKDKDANPQLGHPQQKGKRQLRLPGLDLEIGLG
jgi:hypothetical protein